MTLALALLLACDPTPAPANPWAEAAALDTRAPVPLTPKMAEHQKANMRDHLLAVQQIVAGLATEDWTAIEQAASRLGSSPQSAMMCEHMGADAPGFTERGLAFHATADGIGLAARARDRAAALTALGHTLAACTACHDAYRQQLVSGPGHTAH